jgi:hypothetical protein
MTLRVETGCSQKAVVPDGKGVPILIGFDRKSRFASHLNEFLDYFNYYRFKLYTRRNQLGT